MHQHEVTTTNAFTPNLPSNAGAARAAPSTCQKRTARARTETQAEPPPAPIQPAYRTQLQTLRPNPGAGAQPRIIRHRPRHKPSHLRPRAHGKRATGIFPLVPTVNGDGNIRPRAHDKGRRESSPSRPQLNGDGNLRPRAQREKASGIFPLGPTIKGVGDLRPRAHGKGRRKSPASRPL